MTTTVYYTDVNCCTAKCDLILTNNNELDYKAHNTPHVSTVSERYKA